MCGVFGVVLPAGGQAEAAQIAALGLFALQHRGQESAGVAVSDGRELMLYKDLGMIASVLDERRLPSLRGNLAIAHCRYSTTGSTVWENAQPTFRLGPRRAVAVGHNGNLVNTRELLGQLRGGRARLPASTDTELLTALLADEPAADTVEALLQVLPRVRGAYSLVILDERRVIGVRDPYGFRPLVLGRLPAPDAVDGAVEPGLWGDDDAGGRLDPELRDDRPRHRRRGVRPGRRAGRDRRPRGRPAAALGPLRRGDARRCACSSSSTSPGPTRTWRAATSTRPAGRWACSSPTSIRSTTDLVMPVPGHRRPRRGRLRRALGHPVPRGPRPQPLHRPDVHPAVADAPPSRRDAQAQPAPRGRPGQAADRRRRLDRPRHDDQADRRAAPKAGAAEVHVRISAPPIYHPCFYGIDTQIETELIAATQSSRRDPARSSGPIRSATCRSPACSPRSSCRTTVLLRLLRRQLPGAGPVRRPEPQVHARGGARRRRRAAARPARRAGPGVAWLTLAGPMSGPGSTSPRASGRSSSSATRSSRPAVPRSSAGWAGSPARSGCRPASAIRCSSARPTGSGPRPRSPRRSSGSTRSGSTSSRCAPTTSSAAAPRRCSSSTTSRSAGSTRPTWPSSSGGSPRAAARLAAPCSVARRPSTPGSWTRTRSTWPGSASGSSSATGSIDGSPIRAGDAIVGLAASGLHANGFSLVRALVAQFDLDLRSTLPGAAAPVARRRRPRTPRWPSSPDSPWPPSARSSSCRPGSTPGRSSGSGPRSRRPATTCAGSPTSPAAGCRATCRGRCRTDSAPGSIPAAGRCRRSCVCSARSAGSRTTSSGRRSTAGSGWSSSSRPRPLDATIAALAAEAIPAWHVGEVVPAADARRPALRRGRDPVTAAGRRIAVGVSGARLEPARAGRRRRPRRARRHDRARLRRPRLSGPRLGDGAGDRHGARPGGGADDRDGRAAEDAALAATLTAAQSISSSWPATCGSSARPRWRRSRIGSSTPIRRCCRRSPARMPCATRWPTASRVTGATVHLVDATLDGGPIVAQDAVPILRRRRRGHASTSGSERSSTGSCRGPWRSPWPAPSGSSQGRGGSR